MGSAIKTSDDLWKIIALITHDFLLIREPGSAWYIRSWLELGKPGRAT
jgi:hypothetical protein